MANRVSFVVIAKDAFTNVARKVAASTKKMRKGFKGLDKSLGGATSKFKQLAGAAIAFFGIRKFFTEGIKFEEAIADLSSITGAAGKDLKFLSDESLRLARVSKISAAEVATSFKVVASGKSELLKTEGALIKVTEQVLLLKNATGLDLAQASDIVIQSLNQFGAGADEAGRFVNVLAAGAKVGASEVSETGVAIVKSAVSARLAGVSFEELNAAIQVLAKGGIKGEVAGTGLQSVFLKLEAQSNKRFKPSIVGLSKALENLARKNLSTSKLTKLFGQEAIKQGVTLINSRKLVDEWTISISNTQVATEQAKIRLATFGAKLRGLGIIINEVLIKTFLKLEEKKVFTNLANDFAKWVQSIKEGDIQKLADSIKSMADSISIITKGLGLVKSGFVGVGRFLGEEAARTVLTFTGDASGVINVERQRKAAREALKNVSQKTPPITITPVIPDNVITINPNINIDAKVTPVVPNVKVVTNVTPVVPNVKVVPINPKVNVAPIIDVAPKVNVAPIINVAPQIKVAPVVPVTVNPQIDKKTPIGVPTIPENFKAANQPSPVEPLKKLIEVRSQADVNINISSPKGVISSVKSVARTPNLNVGVNMERTAG